MLRASSPTSPWMAPRSAPWLLSSIERRIYPTGKQWGSKTRIVLPGWGKKRRRRRLIGVGAKHRNGTDILRVVGRADLCRDQELRFTVHEAADYFKLKVSVFNDDKRTDLIGDTWVDLKDLIIPGGGQGDHWHPLQCRGRYAGEVRIEMTYYDTRPEDEAVIERRKGVPEKGQEKPFPFSTGSSSLSGPRQLNDAKRRPLPGDPSGSQYARPPRPEKVPSAPAAPVPQPPARQFEHAHFPPAPSNSMHPRRPDRPYDMTLAGPASHPTRTYESPDDFRRRDQMSQPHPPSFHYPQGYSYEQSDPYGMHPHQPRRAYDIPLDYRRDMMSARPDPVDGVDMRGRVAYGAPPRPNHQYPTVPEQKRQMPYGQVGPPQSMYEPPGLVRPAGSEPARPRSQHGNPARNPRSEIHRENFSEYAAMQPRVEDEEDEGPPPPPPVHRSGLVHPGQMQPSYGGYTLNQRPESSHSSHSQSNTRLPDASQASGKAPATLVAGYDPIIAEDEAERARHESQMAQRNSRPVEEAPVQYPEPLSFAPPYPAEPSQNVDERRKSMESRGSAHSDPRVIQRKSVSPQPRQAAEQEPSIPFSPDSYDALNPNAGRSAVTREPKPAYDTPAGAMDAARQSEAEAKREPGPIVGDDGREIDPSDHLPTDTWAPEPERKNRKPEVIIRFKKSNANPSARDSRGGYKPQPAEPSPGWRRQPHVPDATARTPPRSHEDYGRGQSIPKTNSPYRNSAPPSRSPCFYAPNTGPPIPNKVPIAQPANQNHATASNNPGMDALSRELKSIDIGSVGCTPGRGRRYVPPSVTGYGV